MRLPKPGKGNSNHLYLVSVKNETAALSDSGYYSQKLKILLILRFLWLIRLSNPGFGLGFR